jgi:hypothetical protein
MYLTTMDKEKVVMSLDYSLHGMYVSYDGKITLSQHAQTRLLEGLRNQGIELHNWSNPKLQKY